MIPQMIPLFGDQEKENVTQYMDNVGFITEFQLTSEFEREIEKYTDIKNCIVVNNGTVALMAAYYAAGLRAGDEILIPNYTMFATYSAAKVLGLNVILVDCEPHGGWVDIGDLSKKISSKTKAFVTVATNGRYPKIGYGQFRKLATEHNLMWVEDAAQALGSLDLDGLHIGSKADIATISFSAPKIISTGQGGAILTNSHELARKVKLFKDFGRTSGGQDFHESIGLNLKFTELQAAVGLAQMSDIVRRVQRKKDIYHFYRDNIKNDSIELLENDTTKTAPWFYEVKTKRKQALQDYLIENGVGCRSVYPPLNTQEAIKEPGHYPNSHKHSDQTLWIPSSVQISQSDLEYIAEVLNKF